jgi:hypothetical protein
MRLIHKQAHGYGVVGWKFTDAFIKRGFKEDFF